MNTETKKNLKELADYIENDLEFEFSMNPAKEENECVESEYLFTRTDANPGEWHFDDDGELFLSADIVSPLGFLALAFPEKGKLFYDTAGEWLDEYGLRDSFEDYMSEEEVKWCFSWYWFNVDNSREGFVKRIYGLLEKGLPKNWRDQLFTNSDLYDEWLEDNDIDKVEDITEHEEYTELCYQ